jgi:hypothetical protein
MPASVAKKEPDMLLAGGNRNRVAKDADSVVRVCGPWSAFTQQLLEYLTARGFEASPILLARLGDRERLSYFEGEVGHDPLPVRLQAERIVCEAGRLLRRFHDLTEGFPMPPDPVFLLPVRTAHEVICHNDFAPYNCMFRDDHLVGMIDFDTAGPGTRLWDIAYAVYRFVPLMTDRHCTAEGWVPVPDRSARLVLFCDAYGLADRGGLCDAVLERLEELIRYLAEDGTDQDHLPVYREDLAWLRDNRSLFPD